LPEAESLEAKVCPFPPQSGKRMHGSGRENFAFDPHRSTTPDAYTVYTAVFYTVQKRFCTAVHIFFSFSRSVFLHFSALNLMILHFVFFYLQFIF